MSDNNSNTSPVRKLAAIMFTDIVGYSAIMGKNSSKAMEMVRVNRDLQKPLVEKHNGKWLKEMGDGVMVQFDTALDAVNCAVEIQKDAGEMFDGKLRIGIHLGDITIENQDVYGDGVNIASRLESITDAGGIYISDSVEKSIRGQTGIQAKYLGEINLKNVDYGVRTYALQGEGLPIPNLSGKKQLTGRFTAELIRRGVIRAGVTYIWLSIVLIFLKPYIHSLIRLPSWLDIALIIFLIIGFPFAMYLAWNYEKSPEGFIKTSSKESWQNPYKESQRKPLTSNILIALMGLTIALIFIYPNYIKKSNDQAGLEESVKVEDKSIAVMPFDNLSNDESNQYFADGQMEAILNHLTRIADLRVISRTTMMNYSSTDKSIPEIADELEVRYVLEGSVQKAGDKIRITAQLIDPESDGHIWSNTYDRNLNDIFAIQTEIAKSVARELKTTISTNAQNNMASIPTNNLDAYDYYLKGMNYRNRSNEEEDIRFAGQMYQRAVDIDPNFALAWVGLASSSRRLYWFHFDRREELLKKTKEYLDKAIALDPELMEVQIETGAYFYHCKLDYQRALDILLKLKSEYPKNDLLYITIAYVYRRMGQFQIALSYIEQAISLNPSAWINWHIAEQTFNVLGRYAEAEESALKAIDLNPSEITNYFVLTGVYLNMGEVNKARSLLENNQHIDHNMIEAYKAKIELYDRNYQQAINLIENSPFEGESNQFSYIPKALQLALIYYSMSDKELARIHFEEAKVVLEDKLKEFPDDSRIYSSLGISYAGLGLNKEALAVNKKALGIINISIDAMRGSWREWDYARILMMIGENEEAIKKIDFLLGYNGHISVEQLKRDPFWDPLRDMDDFKAIINNPEYQVSTPGNI